MSILKQRELALGFFFTGLLKELIGKSKHFSMGGDLLAYPLLSRNKYLRLCFLSLSDLVLELSSLSKNIVVLLLYPFSAVLENIYSFHHFSTNFQLACSRLFLSLRSLSICFLGTFFSPNLANRLSYKLFMKEVIEEGFSRYFSNGSELSRKKLRQCKEAKARKLQGLDDLVDDLEALREQKKVLSLKLEQEREKNKIATDERINKVEDFAKDAFLAKKKYEKMQKELPSLRKNYEGMDERFEKMQLEKAALEKSQELLLNEAQKLEKEKKAISLRLPEKTRQLNELCEETKACKKSLQEKRHELLQLSRDHSESGQDVALVKQNITQLKKNLAEMSQEGKKIQEVMGSSTDNLERLMKETELSYEKKLSVEKELERLSMEKINALSQKASYERFQRPISDDSKRLADLITRLQRDIEELRSIKERKIFGYKD